MNRRKSKILGGRKKEGLRLSAIREPEEDSKGPRAPLEERKPPRPKTEGGIDPLLGK